MFHLPAMRWILSLACSALIATSALAADVEFLHVWPQWHNADTFERIGSYFGRADNDGRDTILRTEPGEKAGLYFLARVKSAVPLAGAKLTLEIIRPDSPDPKAYSFPVNIGAQNHLYQLGLTGADWPGGRAVHPVAWKLSLVDREGRPVATQQSFLWEKPAK